MVATRTRLAWPRRALTRFSHTDARLAGGVISLGAVARICCPGSGGGSSRRSSRAGRLGVGGTLWVGPSWVSGPGGRERGEAGTLDAAFRKCVSVSLRAFPFPCQRLAPGPRQGPRGERSRASAGALLAAACFPALPPSSPSGRCTSSPLPPPSSATCPGLFPELLTLFGIRILNPFVLQPFLPSPQSHSRFPRLAVSHVP